MSAAPLRVVLVEDNPNDARLIRRYLKEARTAFLPDEVAVEHVERLEAGMAALDGSTDLLLLDLGLPGSSGAETFERARERVSGVPVIVLTGLEDERTAVDLLQRGAQDYINKGSLSEEKLAKSVRYAMERQEREQTLRTTTEQLEVLNRILRHDIQNDVQVLRSWSQGLAERVPEEHTPDVRKITETSRRIEELTENSRAFIRTVTGERDVETEPTRLDTLLAEELEKVRSRYPDASFEAGDLSAVVVDANGMLSSVFRNLLNNAVQHTRPAANVDVDLETAGESARVTVADDGPGVPDGRKEAVFGRGEYGLDSQGTGIGLYLVDTLVTGFGGSVRVEDRADGQGAVFVVELPRADVEEWTVGG